MKRISVIILFFIIIVLSVVQVVVANSISTTGIILSKLHKEIATYEKENGKLKDEILTQSSYTRIASIAGELGYVEAKSPVSLSAPLPLALVQ
ncbi:MAG TPA: hypothetical protein VJC10_03325 [Patescibacteria group bacterium]|nr:hypothetical protein [Patescibacteria group bacterium]